MVKDLPDVNRLAVVFFSFSFLTSFNLWIKHMILKVIQRLLEVNR
jgi:hypothetical protein